MLRGSILRRVFGRFIAHDSGRGHPPRSFLTRRNECKFTRGAATESHAVRHNEKSNYGTLVERGLYLDKAFPRSAKARVTNLGVVDGGRNVEVTWDDRIVSRYHSLWLRHACHCPSCRLPTNQSIVSFQHMDMDTRVTQVEKEDEKILKVVWSDDDNHTGLFPLPFLKNNDYSVAAKKERENQKVMKFKHKDKIPEVSYDDFMTSESTLYRWLMTISDYGICLIRNVPSRLGEVTKVAGRISVIQQFGVFGQVYDVRMAAGPDSFAYTSNKLALHMDMPIYQGQPGIQFLHVVRFDKEVTGGESRYVDLYHVVEQFREKHPREFRDLVRIPATWETIFYGGDFPQHLVYQIPHISLNPEGKVIGVRWHPASTGVLQTKQEDVEPYYMAYKKLETMIETFPLMHNIRLEEGDLITMNNRRWLHGRTAYDQTNGVRHLQGCYVDIDEFQSKVQLYSNKMGDGKLATRVGNQSWG